MSTNATVSDLSTHLAAEQGRVKTSLHDLPEWDGVDRLSDLPPWDGAPRLESLLEGRLDEQEGAVSGVGCPAFCDGSPFGSGK